MDKIEALGNSIAQISIYDIKSYYNQAKAVVLNYTEMEAKVRDATNDDPWGASSTLMQEIAQGQQFNEIMPTIYKRFTEKEAREWRQIYKALQLLEYLIKHGSERVIDDARSHISMIKILRNFHYVDDKGKDQGINVRNRAKEIAELLSDLDRVRQERRKAKASRNKYVGVGNEGLSFNSSSGSKYGGFGNDTGSYGNGEEWNNGTSGSSKDRYGGGSGSFKQNDDFEEYDAGEWEDRPNTSAANRTAPSTSRGSVSSARKNSIVANMKKPAEKATPPSKVPEVDLFSIDDDEPTVTSPQETLAKPADNFGLDDEFDDFQSAPTAPASQKSVPQSNAAKPNVFALLSSTPSTVAVPPSGQAQMMKTLNPSVQSQSSFSNSGMFNSSSMHPMLMNSGITNNYNPANSIASQPVQSKTAQGSTTKAADDFGDLFSFAGMATGGNSVPSKPNQPKISMAAMAREQSSASIWGGATASNKPNSTVPSGGNNDDLLL
ncbi:epsin-3 [Phakopsora pachyrhizi]|uniref:Epsin-3 n=1 Tax=Phakopsora pachyrhizi TaxID=170000 RepID=A0AAV0BL66_PHAPC|nr:epsin-3 [Phakopsora pachyrhizi]CAH7687363.1 epsin-3 [Phakopsora pachyrhizi]